MAKTTHTPGPWQPSPEGNVWAPNASHSIIAKIGENKRPCSEHAANARLIAAAPELLEACKLVDKWDGGAIDCLQSWAEMRDAITSAIQKAEGGAK